MLDVLLGREVDLGDLDPLLDVLRGRRDCREEEGDRSSCSVREEDLDFRREDRGLEVSSSSYS